MCGGKTTYKGVNPSNLHAVLSKLEKTACKIRIKDDIITVTANKRPESLGKIETAVFPGVPTDMQPELLALQTISNGSCMIVENLFESRYKHVPELIKMGADIHLRDRIAFVNGVKKLYGADVVGCDLRGAASLALAGMAAEGYTTLDNAQFIDRGYLNFADEFAKLGADIKRIE